MSNPQFQSNEAEEARCPADPRTAAASENSSEWHYFCCFSIKPVSTELLSKAIEEDLAKRYPDVKIWFELADDRLYVTVATNAEYEDPHRFEVIWWDVWRRTRAIPSARR